MLFCVGQNTLNIAILGSFVALHQQHTKKFPFARHASWIYLNSSSELRFRDEFFVMLSAPKITLRVIQKFSNYQKIIRSKMTEKFSAATQLPWIYGWESLQNTPLTGKHPEWNIFAHLTQCWTKQRRRNPAGRRNINQVKTMGVN